MGLVLFLAGQLVGGADELLTGAGALQSGLEDALAGEDHFDLRRPHAERHGAQRPVRRGVAVAADDGHARLCESQFGADDVHDALARVAHAEMFDAEFGAGVCTSPGREGHAWLDLEAAQAIQLIEAGLKCENITLMEKCTFEDEEHLFSHRRDTAKLGGTGDMAAYIRIV